MLMEPTDSHPMSEVQRPMPRSDGVLERDAALLRVRRMRRLAVAGSAALSAAFAYLVSTSPPGKATARANSTRTAALTASRTIRPKLAAPALPPLESAGALGLGGGSAQSNSSPPTGNTGSSSGNTGSASGNTGTASGNTGNTGNTGSASGNTGNTGSATGNTGTPPAAAAPPVVSGGS